MEDNLCLVREGFKPLQLQLLDNHDIPETLLRVKFLLLIVKFLPGRYFRQF
jgi:hypothetical protein